MPSDAKAERPSRVAREGKSYKAEARALGLRVRKLRQERGWTLQEAEEQMQGLDWKHLQKIEAGILNVTLVSLVRIADGLGVAVRNLFPAPRRRST